MFNHLMLAAVTAPKESEGILNIFQGIDTLIHQFMEAENLHIAIARIGFVLLACAMIYLGRKGVLEGLLMIPMGLGMIAINAACLVMPGPNPNDLQLNETKLSEVCYQRGHIEHYITPNADGKDVQTLPSCCELCRKDPIALNAASSNPYIAERQTLFVKSTMNTETVSGATALMNWLQINCFQPVYTFTFSNGLIACFVFMGIGALLDVGYVLARPFQSMFIALMGEMGTILVLPLAVLLGRPITEAASIAMVGCADGPMVLFTALQLSPKLFAPITVVAYLYLGFCYGGYPYMIQLLVPEKLRKIAPEPDVQVELSSSEKLVFAVLTTIILCFLFPVAAPLFLSLFLGISVKEAGLKDFHDLLAGPVLYFSTLMLGLVLGLLCDAETMLSEQVLWVLILGIFALLVSGMGGLMGGYILYFVTGGKFNPAIGIAGVSCIPTCAKVAQKTIGKVNPGANVMPNALGASISGVITSAIICGIYVSLFKNFAPLFK